MARSRALSVSLEVRPCACDSAVPAVRVLRSVVSWVGVASLPATALCRSGAVGTGGLSQRKGRVAVRTARPCVQDHWGAPGKVPSAPHACPCCMPCVTHISHVPGARVPVPRLYGVSASYCVNNNAGLTHWPLRGPLSRNLATRPAKFILQKVLNTTKWKLDLQRANASAATACAPRSFYGPQTTTPGPPTHHAAAR